MAEMRRPRPHVMEREAEQLINELLPSAWIVREVARDYGIDFEIELVDQEMDLLSTAISSYEGFQERFIVSPPNAALHSLQDHTGDHTMMWPMTPGYATEP